MTEFEEIYRTYFNDVYRYLLRLSGDQHVAEELTSQTFFKAMQGIQTFRGDCEVRVWLCQIGKNCYLTYVKGQTRTQQLDEAQLLELPEEGDSPEQLCERRDQAMCIRKVLHQLPDPYKEVFLWRVFAELSFKEIGQMFGKTHNWACVTYHRAKAMVRQRLEENET